MKVLGLNEAAKRGVTGRGLLERFPCLRGCGLLKPIPQTGATDGRVEPLRRRMIEDMTIRNMVAGATAILHQRGFEVSR